MRDEINSHITQSVQNQFRTKTELLSLAYKGFLAETEEFESYVAFVSHRVKQLCINSLHNWIKAAFFKTNHDEETDRSTFILVEEAVQPKMCLITDVVLQTKLKSSKNVTLVQWMKLLRNNLSEKDIRLVDSINVSDELIILDVDRFIKNIVTFARNVQQSVEKYARTPDYEQIMTDNNELTIYIDKLWGCNDLCSVCQDPCHCSGKQNIDSTHWCLIHQPVL